MKKNTAAKEIMDLMEILPESDQNLALEIVRKLVLAWDPDFTKLTPAERAELEEAERSIEQNGTVPHDAIKWE